MIIAARQSDSSGETIFYRSHDDLLLHVRKYGGDGLPGRPLVCLAELTRNGRDFHALAMALSKHPATPRTVYCLDYRGHGYSEWDRNWRNYSVDVELRDVIAFLTLQGLNDVAVLGSSRGGIVAMMLAAVRPAAIGCAIFNDIGPVIETSGLARIMGYTGKLPVPRNWDEARRIVIDVYKRQFVAMDEAGWEALTRQLFNETNGSPAPAYDPNVGKALSEIDISRPIPTMWDYFATLRDKPVMVIRGETSDVLSAATVQEMQARHPGLTSVLIHNEGHVPLLHDRFSQRLIADFLSEADRSWRPEAFAPFRRHEGDATLALRDLTSP